MEKTLKFELKLNKVYRFDNDKQQDNLVDCKCKIYLNDEKKGKNLNTISPLEDNQEENCDYENESLIFRNERKLELKIPFDHSFNHIIRVECLNLGMFSRYPTFIKLKIL